MYNVHETHGYVCFACVEHTTALLLLTHKDHATGAHQQQQTCQQEHAAFRCQPIGRGKGTQYQATGSCRHNLRHTNRSVKQTKVGAHVSTGKGVRQDGERQGKHGCPGATYQQEGHEEGIDIVHEKGGDETGSTQEQAQ